MLWGQGTLISSSGGTKSTTARSPGEGKGKNPYLIWISEVMLQQTTVQAVIPYYKKFIKKISHIKGSVSNPFEGGFALLGRAGVLSAGQKPAPGRTIHS